MVIRSAFSNLGAGGAEAALSRIRARMLRLRSRGAGVPTSMIEEAVVNSEQALWLGDDDDLEDDDLEDDDDDAEEDEEDEFEDDEDLDEDEFDDDDEDDDDDDLDDEDDPDDGLEDEE
jgi:hypothetical protein